MMSTKRPRIRHRHTLFLAVVLLHACGAGGAVVSSDASVRHQKMAGWGTSIIWWSTDVPYYDQAWRAAYRDLGLNMLRIDMKKDVLVDPGGDLRVPVHLGPDLQANIDKMDFANFKTQVFGDLANWLQQDALEPRRVKIVGSVWSPPHWMKGPTGWDQAHVLDPGVRKPTPWLSDNQIGDSIGGRLLQTESNREQFARFLAAWVEGFEQHHGVPLHAISIQNEVSYENPFDSATYLVGLNRATDQYWQYANALKTVKDEFERQNITTNIKGPHMAHIGPRPSFPWALTQQMGFIAAVKGHTDDTLIDFIDYYNSNDYQGTDEDAVKMLAAYYRGMDQIAGAWPTWTVAPGIEQDRKPVWISESAGSSGQWLDGGGGTPGTGAITVALKMFNAIVHGQASAYLYWQMTETNGDADETTQTLLASSAAATPLDSKKYASFKHFSRYVRPGAQRIETSFENGLASIGGASEYDTINSLNVAGFVHEQDQTLTYVLLNLTGADESVTIEIEPALAVARLHAFATSQTQSFAPLNDLLVQNDQVSLNVPSYSLITLWGQTAPIPEPGVLFAVVLMVAVVAQRRARHEREWSNSKLNHE